MKVPATERMMAIARMVESAKTVSDIGCDHAYTSIYLIEAGIAKHVIAMDINQGPLGVAKKNIEQYEIVTARAVAHLSILLEYGLPMLKNNYYFIAMKGNLEVEIEESNKALEILNSKIEKIEEFKLPLENSNRTLIKIKKIKSCPKKYPRKYSEIKKQKL